MDGIEADAHMGTWKLNESKSKPGGGATKNHTTVTTSSTDAKGNGIPESRDVTFR
jgi:hypothetical protein